jgi:tetratricopeptide (TPR) repeat protein
MMTAETLRVESRRLAARGAWTELSTLLQENSAVARSHPECARLLGESLLRLGRAREAREWFGDILPEMRGTDDRLTLRTATVQLGAAHLELGEIEPARRAFEETLELARWDHDDVLVARAMNNLGIVANIEGRWDEAIALYALAITVHQRNGDSRGLSEGYHNLAITHRDRGELAEADELERRSVEFAREAEQERLVALARLGRAEIALRRRDFALAEMSARRLAADFERLGDPIRQADATRLAGVACMGRRRYADAAELLDRALEDSRRIGALLNVAETLRARAEMHLAQGDADSARADAMDAMEAYRSLGATREIESLDRWLADVSDA